MFLVTIPYCVSFDDSLMNGMVIIDKVRIVVTVDIAPVFELWQLVPYVRHLRGFQRERGTYFRLRFCLAW